MPQLDKPECGWWRVRLTKGGPFAAASIQYEQTLHEPGEPSNLMERSAIMTARINGEVVLLADVWERRKEPITKASHDYMVADTAWAKKFSPDEPQANPRKKVDWLQAPLPF
jgi:hypothetical protein